MKQKKQNERKSFNLFGLSKTQTLWITERSAMSAGLTVDFKSLKNISFFRWHFSELNISYSLLM